jgi:CBS-domain-containing membrane protein
MKTFAKSLRELTAGDIMKQPVVTIPQELSVRMAAGLLQREQITGAAVIDANGCCVGVLSATDFMRLAERGRTASTRACPEEPCFSDWQVIDVETLPRDEVRSHMSRDVVTASASTPIAELSRMMLDAHIHRVFVVDQARRPVGVVSSMDIIAAVANAEADVPCETSPLTP